MQQMDQKTQKLLNANILVLTSSHDRVTLLALDGLKKKKKDKYLRYQVSGMCLYA